MLKQRENKLQYHSRQTNKLLLSDFGRDMGCYHEETSQPTYTMNQATKHSTHHNKARSLHNRNLAITVKTDARWIGTHGNKVLLIKHGPTQIMPNLEAK